MPLKVEVQKFVKEGHDVNKLTALKRSRQEEMGADPQRLVLDKIKGSQ